MTTGVAHLKSDGFQGHGCLFCGELIPVADTTQLPIRISTAGRTAYYWAHRACFRGHAKSSLHPSINRIPPAAEADVLPSRPA